MLSVGAGMRGVISVILIFGFLMLSCAKKPGDIKTYEERNPYPAVEERVQASPGSIFTGSLYWADLYGENRASRPGDVIFIRVVESLNAIETVSSQIGRSTEFTNAIASFFGVPQNTLQNLSSEAEGEFTAQGRGQIRQQAQLTTRLAGRVIKVYPNGTMLIEAKKYISINGIRREFILRGIVRPEDIDSTNTVSSDRIANMEIYLDGKGYIAEGGKPGWLARIFALLFPF